MLTSLKLHVGALDQGGGGGSLISHVDFKKCPCLVSLFKKKFRMAQYHMSNLRNHYMTWPICENKKSGDSPVEQNKYLFWAISLVDNVHRIVSDMTDEQPY